MNSNLKKYIVGAVIIVAFVGYLIFSNENSQVATTTTTNPSPAASGTTGSSITTTPGTSTSTGGYKDGTYTGSVADAFYGKIQVAAVIQGGQLTDVQVLQSPQNGGHSQQLSTTALPVLKQEAIAAQSAQVNIVSGATQDSQAFQQSLAAALAEAK